MSSDDEAALAARAIELLNDALTGVVAIYLFGSRSTGEESPESDVDLAVLARQPVDPVILYDVARRLDVTLGIEVDLVDLLRAPTVLKKEVLEHGAVIFCADPAATLEFEARSLSEYGRYREGIEPLLRTVRETGRAYAP